MQFPGGLDPSEPVGALALMIVGTTTPFPAEISAIGVSMKHDFWPGLGLVWSGAMIGALISYGVAGTIRNRAGWLRRMRSVRSAEVRLRDLGWLGVLGLRLVPLVPFFALSIAAGLLNVPLRAYLQGTAIGILPASVLLTLAGQGLISDDRWKTSIVLIGLAGGLFLWLLFKRRAASRE